MATPRLSPASTVLHGHIYVAGGLDARGDRSDETFRHGITNLERYDPATNSWTTLAPLPFPRRRFAAGMMNDKICVFGGGLSTNVDTRSWPETWCYDPAADAWDFGPLMLHETYHWAGDGVAGTGNGSAIYAFGGGSSGYKMWVSHQTSAARRLTSR
jgi:N-acetylneuraminic acid mutarotase